MKTTTVTREYDDQGRVVREIRTEVETPDLPPIYGDDYWWQLPRKGWWQNPVVSWSVQMTPNSSAPTLVN